MNATWITLAVAIIAGATKFFSWYTGPARRLLDLKKELVKKGEEYAQALANNDTVRISQLDIDMRRLRAEIRSLSK